MLKEPYATFNRMLRRRARSLKSRAAIIGAVLGLAIGVAGGLLQHRIQPTIGLVLAGWALGSVIHQMRLAWGDYQHIPKPFNWYGDEEDNEQP